MGIIESQISFKDISKTPWLSSRPSTCNYIQKELPTFLNEYLRNKFELLGSKSFLLRSGEYIAEKNYDAHETKYVYISVRNFSGFDVNLISANFLDEKEGKKYKAIALEDQDIIITRSATVGCVHIFRRPDDKIYIPSHHLSVLRSNDTLEFKQFCVFWLRTKHCQRFFEAYATGKIQKEINNWSIRKVPIPKVENISKIVSCCSAKEVEIRGRNEKIVSLQKIIDEILVEYNIKEEYSESFFEVLNSRFSKINNQVFLRCGAQYRAFWDKHGGLLFEGTNNDVPLRRLSELMKLMNTTTLKKGVLDDDYILIELEDIEAGTGRIINEDKVVSEIGSDKVCFEDCDLISSKMRPYLGYTILNDVEKNYIGTTELLPFRVNINMARPEYLKYILLSHDYLKKSELLMYGKEHPRIHPLDLLNIKVPCPDFDVQDTIINEIKDLEDKNNELRNQIDQLRKEIDEVIWNTTTKTGEK